MRFEAIAPQGDGTSGRRQLRQGTILTDFTTLVRRRRLAIPVWQLGWLAVHPIADPFDDVGSDDRCI